MSGELEPNYEESLLDKNNKNLSAEEQREYNEWAKMEMAFSWRFIFLINVFLACVSFSIVLPSLWPYL